VPGDPRHRAPSGEGVVRSASDPGPTVTTARRAPTRRADERRRVRFPAASHPRTRSRRQGRTFAMVSGSPASSHGAELPASAATDPGRRPEGAPGQTHAPIRRSVQLR
jgi:hypothetical protein